ncbi:MAG: hypothetical protein IJM37_01135 [Lachnospiraceae bacterium]|nr:hypothetical protein [Lachnospiraceae bacterium]
MEKRKIISILLILAVLISAVPFTSFAGGVQTGRFSYMPAFEDVTEETYYYSDDYFRQSSRTENEHLQTMSLNLALSTFEIRGASYTTKLLEDTGFTNIAVADMVEKPSRDTIGSVIASKKVDDYNLIAVAIRGEKYDSEWASNFIVGKEGDAKGFKDSADKVLARLKAYISENSLTKNKIWITGYSRAGAISDLMGVYINKNLTEFETSYDDLYVYTFEAPAASVDDTVYDNIYNIVNINDLIPYVYPKNWGMHTNGRLIKIGGPQTITTYTGLTEQTEYGQAQLDEFLAEFIDWLSDRLPREVYSENLDMPVSNLFEIAFDKPAQERTRMINFIKDDVLTTVMNNPEYSEELYDKAWMILVHRSDYVTEKIADLLKRVIDYVRNSENGKVFTDQEIETIKDSVFPLLKVAIPIVLDDEHYYDGIDYDEYYDREMPEYNMSDYDLGVSHGSESGFSNGYDDGFMKQEKDAVPAYIADFGPEYLNAYLEVYQQEYDKGYVLGQAHSEDLKAKADYDAKRMAGYSGYSDGRCGDERKPYDEYLFVDDWMTDEYLEEYNRVYEEQYNIGYDEGAKHVDDPVDEPNVKDLYHIATVIKNVDALLLNHYPQTNLKLVQARDSYYNGGLPAEETKESDEGGQTQAETKNEMSPATGDNVNYYLIALVMSLAGITLAGVYSNKKILMRR